MAVPAPSRPRFPPGYGVEPGWVGPPPEWANIAEKLVSARTYWVATTRGDGRPHAAPVWGIWWEDEFWFSTDPASVKGRNLARDPRLVVHLESGDEVVIVEGVARILPLDTPGVAGWVEAYDLKYGVRFDMEAPIGEVLAVRPARASSWVEADFPTTAVEWRWPEE